MKSIKQKSLGLALPGALPDFRNLGVMLRILLLVNLLALGTVAIAQSEGASFFVLVLQMGSRLELPLFVVILGLYALQPWLVRQRRDAAYGVVFAWVAAVVLLVQPLMLLDAAPLIHSLLWALVATCVVLVYFDYRLRAYSPSLSEARLQALTARIRPHFLFNSLNGVLGVIRSDPRRAERALEELAELFRVLMQDNRELVTLEQELRLCERYLDLERLRLDERLQVDLQLDEVPGDALVPPLLIQPLVENAVYHGIEPSLEPGVVEVAAALKGGVVEIRVSSPILDAPRHQPGNNMALANIRERLMLFFDLEAKLDIAQDAGRYVVRIRIPYRRRR